MQGKRNAAQWPCGPAVGVKEHERMQLKLKQSKSWLEAVGSNSLPRLRASGRVQRTAACGPQILQDDLCHHEQSSIITNQTTGLSLQVVLSYRGSNLFG